MKKICLLWMGLLMVGASLQAQQVNTMYFLENAPMRHIINPAFQPVSNFYFELPIIGYTSSWGGSNYLSMQDLIYKVGDQTVTAFHDASTQKQLWEHLPKSTLFDVDWQTNLLSFGFRLKQVGYVHLNITQRTEIGFQIPKQSFAPFLGQTLNSTDLSDLGLSAQAWIDIALGYSHKISDEWTVGGKAKLLLGSAFAGVTFTQFNIQSDPTLLQLQAQGYIAAAGPFNWSQLPTKINIFDMSSFKNVVYSFTDEWQQYLKPSGYGAALDLGMTYKPISQLQVTASVTDLGFIHWNKSAVSNADFKTTFNGLGDFTVNDFKEGDEFSLNKVIDAAKNKLTAMADSLNFSEFSLGGFNSMPTTKLNIGVDANFWDNRVGVGVYSKTKFFHQSIYEEVTIGAALRPCNWFNIATSYSFVNGRWGSIGAAMSLATYDGIMFTLAADYISLNNASYNNTLIPYKTNGLNLAFGVSIVAGTNHKRSNKDTDTDGVPDYWDVSPLTPKHTPVDRTGTPLDQDGDGVQDMRDKCPGTPSAAYGMIDTLGCPLDSDSDGVANYKDKCPHTLPDARKSVDETGCNPDKDGDGVPDYIDQCPNTPPAAYGQVDSVGCPLDSDGDGVPDYIDKCPNTPIAAKGKVDEFGCPLDGDKDGVPDYLDKCPNTPIEARNQVDSVGCPIDSDKDGVPDYMDLCPTIAGSIHNHGCPEVKKEIRTLLQKAMQGIQFETGKSKIKPASYPLLDQIAKTFIENKDFYIEVQGHTDNVGSPKFNMELSEKRAQAVRNYLVGKGVEPVRIEAHGYGDTKPIDDNATKTGRAQNRRVEFIITFEHVSYETINDRVEEQNNTNK